MEQILVDPYSKNPNKAFEKLVLEKKFVKEKFRSLALNEPRVANKVRVVVISDTHSKIDKDELSLPEADILIHAGDFTMHGTTKEIKKFVEYLDSLKHIKYKIIIAGNHDKAFDERKNESRVDLARDLLKNYIYLQDSGVNILGLNIWGTPWQPYHCGNAFQIKRGEPLLEKWNLIPNNTDILVTHTPPLGYGDNYHVDHHAGCVDLYNTVKYRVKPKFNVFGHIHEDYGAWTDGITNFINASICSSYYKPNKKPILFDIDSEIFFKSDSIERF